MSIRNSVVRARVTEETKVESAAIFKNLGLSVSEAINLFLVQVKLKKSLPFNIEIPNKETAKAIEETKARKGLIRCKNADDLFEKLEMLDS